MQTITMEEEYGMYKLSWSLKDIFAKKKKKHQKK